MPPELSKVTVKNSKTAFMRVLSLSVLIGLSSTSFAELVMNGSSGGSGQAALSWSSSDANQLLNGDTDVEEYSPQGSTSVSTTIRSGSAPVPASTKSPNGTDF